MRNYFVYILTNWNNTVMYIGVTSDLPRRLHEHRSKMPDSFTSRYNVTKLVYAEGTNDIVAAITREKQLKGWRRENKNALVIMGNPQWCDISKEDPSHSFGMTDSHVIPSAAEGSLA